ncbi:probable serine/threonine-protein kinase DDB_G0282963 [Zeugodacus cucurbitae]|uniref:Uncharacterized protein n=1 Tax=Zeugodacus cucurbitae TaxID=28588 RepID=A0A0A1X313_ZEUCU|nr:probable serine/threonine-protein kinase DDB_G0282963 [Zeugodacus cucurbitae]
MWHYTPAICLCAALAVMHVARAAQLPGYVPPQYYHYPAPRNQLAIPAAAPQQQQYSYQQQYARYAQTQQRYVQPQQQQQQQYYQQAQPSAKVAQQFSSPALENAAFTSALTSQGYTFGGNGHASASVSAGRALPSALSLPPSIAETLESTNDIASEGAIDSSDASVNLQLPLPVNIAPIKVQPLPLQAGASFSELANAVTSYGTVYPQRKRR